MNLVSGMPASPEERKEEKKNRKKGTRWWLHGLRYLRPGRFDFQDGGVVCRMLLCLSAMQRTSVTLDPILRRWRDERFRDRSIRWWSIGLGLIWFDLRLRSFGGNNAWVCWWCLLAVCNWLGRFICWCCGCGCRLMKGCVTGAARQKWGAYLGVDGRPMCILLLL